MAAATIRLNQGEEILRDEMVSAFWTWPAYPFSLGLWAIWRRRNRFILTNQRLVVRRGIVQVVERSVPLGRIQDVNLALRVRHAGWVTVSSVGGSLGTERLGPFRQEVAREFADAISHALPRRGAGFW
jgi:membrane protein YdbS with pleckstrin-like domain